jgi:hypothetical protein
VPALAVVNPEPVPFKMPLSDVVTANVPELVIGEPVTENPVGIVSATDETVPAPDGALHANADPFQPRYVPEDTGASINAVVPEPD